MLLWKGSFCMSLKLDNLTRILLSFKSGLKNLVSKVSLPSCLAWDILRETLSSWSLFLQHLHAVMK